MICPYCNNPAQFVDNALVYGRRYGNSYMAYWCKPCNAMVGVHENDPARPLGTMANKELREWRIKAHAAIDPIWKDGRLKRQKVYQWLCRHFQYEVHIGQSNVAQCQAIIAAVPVLERQLAEKRYFEDADADVGDGDF